MSSLTDVYNQISSHDAELLEKQAEQIKIAEEEDAAGRIMARGFADELHKIAAGPGADMAAEVKKQTAGLSNPFANRPAMRGPKATTTGGVVSGNMLQKSKQQMASIPKPPKTSGPMVAGNKQR